VRGRGSKAAGLAELEVGRALTQLRARGGQFSTTRPSRVAKREGRAAEHPMAGLTTAAAGGGLAYAGGRMHTAGVSLKARERRLRDALYRQLGNWNRGSPWEREQRFGRRWDAHVVEPARAATKLRRGGRAMQVGGGVLAVSGLGRAGYAQHDRSRGVAKIATSMNERDAKRVVGQYGLRGSLPRGLPREERMRAYEGRYVAAGGPRGERWQRRAKAGEAVTTASILGAGGAAAAELTARSRRGRQSLKRVGLSPAKVSRTAAGVGLGTVVTGAGGEILRRSAEHRRAKYTSSPAGVAASALRRMRDYTPEG
jgi:hypothetical protein